MKYICCLFMLFFCVCRQEQEVSLRMTSLYEEVGDLKIARDRIDSVISLSRELDPAERYVIICRALNSTNQCVNPDIPAYYRKELNTLPFPVVKNKALGFLLLEQYAPGGESVKMADMDALSSLLFDMENKFKLTPEEKCNFLTLKSGIYSNVFREYRIGFSISEEALELAYKLGFTGEKLFRVYNIQFRCCSSMQEPGKSLDVVHKFLDRSASGLEEEQRQALYESLANLYCKQKEYEKAYSCMINSNRNSDAGRFGYNNYNSVSVDIFLNTGRISELMDYLDKKIVVTHEKFKENRLALIALLCKINWARARGYLVLGELSEYKYYLREAVRYNDLRPMQGYGTEEMILSDAYIRLLLEEGKRDDAVRRIEQLSGLLQRDGLSAYKHIFFDGVRQRLEQFRRLSEYYGQIGRTPDALRLLLICNSLQAVHTEVRLNEERHKSEAHLYMAGLCRNLELRVADYERARQEWLFTFILLGLAVVWVFIFGRLYYRRQKELNGIYARQRKIEQMEALLREREEVEKQEELPADKQLYLRLQKQMHQEKLFLKPDFSRNDLCRLVGSNRMYVSTCINKYAGMNLNLWINKARISHTIDLIHSGKTDLRELARVSGFSSTSAFYRSFKYFTLLSPKQYIEREAKQKILG